MLTQSVAAEFSNDPNLLMDLTTEGHAPTFRFKKGRWKGMSFWVRAVPRSPGEDPEDLTFTVAWTKQTVEEQLKAVGRSFTAMMILKSMAKKPPETDPYRQYLNALAVAVQRYGGSTEIGS